jgi:hypothetical protein
LPPDHVLLLKLLWHPDDFEDGKIKPTAFKSIELSGEPGKFVSVDRDDLAKRETMEKLAADQAAKVNPEKNNLVRAEPAIGKLHCLAVRELRFKDKPAVSVSPYPEAWNDAHCGMDNVSGHKSNSYLLEIRTKLAQLASPALTLDEAYA